MAEGIFIIVEHRLGQIRSESFELAGFGLELAKSLNQSLTALILGHEIQALAEKFAKGSGLRVIGLDNKYLAAYNSEAYLSALTKFFQDKKPSHILISHSVTGWDFASRLAVRLNASCSAGVIKFNSKPALSFIKPIYGGKLLLEVSPLPDTISVITVLPGAYKPVQSFKPGSAEIFPLEIPEPKTRNLGYTESKAGTLDLNKADVIVSVGRGIGKPESLELARKLVEFFDKASLGASRPVVDAGWIPYEYQIGQTGQTVMPRLYLALGISGAIQHIVGMKNSELIIAVNKDPNANIFQVAHIGIVQDLHKFLPVLIAQIQSLCNKPLKT